MNQNTKMILGALVAAGLAIAVFYGLIGQQTANKIQTQADQTLGTAPANQTTTAGTPNPTATTTANGTTTRPAPTAPADVRPDAAGANSNSAPAH